MNCNASYRHNFDTNGQLLNITLEIIILVFKIEKIGQFYSLHDLWRPSELQNCNFTNYDLWTYLILSL